MLAPFQHQRPSVTGTVNTGVGASRGGVSGGTGTGMSGVVGYPTSLCVRCR